MIAGQTRVIVRGGRAPAADAVITFTDPDCHRALLLYASRSQTGIYSRISFFMRYGTIGKKLILAPFALLAAAAVIYGALFELYRLIPVSVDERLGKLIAPKIAEELKPYHNAKLQAVLERMKRRLVPKDSLRQYTISMFDSPVANAFALPDGNIIILTGLIEASEAPDEVAGVLAHEILHVESRHGIRQLIRALGIGYLIHLTIGAGFEELETAETISELSSLLAFLKYSRQFERDADREGVRLLHGSRISCKGLLNLLNRLSGMRTSHPALQWLDSHPSTADRIAFKPLPVLIHGENWPKIKSSGSPR